MGKRPYLCALGARDGVSIWLVDGRWIRNHLDIEFTNGAHVFSRTYVPRLEVWVDRVARGAGELHFIAEHQIVERSLMARGLSYVDALRHANRIERHMRRAARAALGLPGSTDAQERLRRRLLSAPRLLGRVREKVYLVEGRTVRDLLHPDFTQGGHGLRYRFIPRGEVWIDDALQWDERRAVIVHEFVELGLMRNGASYDDAHRRASEIEAEVRAGAPLPPAPIALNG